MTGYTKASENIEHTSPPLAEEGLVKLLKRWRLKNRSDHFPLDNQQAAKWWMAHQEDRGSADTPQPIKKDGVTIGWNTPYHDRLKYNLQRFLKLSEPEKAFVIRHIQEGIPYRGDDINFYKTVVSETQKMKSNPGEYIETGIKAMKRQLRGMVL